MFDKETIFNICIVEAPHVRRERANTTVQEKKLSNALGTLRLMAALPIIIYNPLAAQ